MASWDSPVSPVCSHTYVVASKKLSALLQHVCRLAFFPKRESESVVAVSRFYSTVMSELLCTIVDNGGALVPGAGSTRLVSGNNHLNSTLQLLSVHKCV